MAPLRFSAPLLGAALLLLSACQHASPAMKVYPLSRREPHDGLAVVNQPDGYGLHIWIDTDTRNRDICRPRWNADPARLFNGNGSAPFSSGLASRQEFFQAVRNGRVNQQLKRESEALCKARAPQARFEWSEPPRQESEVRVEPLPPLDGNDLLPDPSALRREEQRMLQKPSGATP
ncbi:MAG: hypothetical protein VKJ87_06625 [Synechococcus sp.]|nr:hypothetical protein [Synechococcus sp.]